MTNVLLTPVLCIPHTPSLCHLPLRAVLVRGFHHYLLHNAADSFTSLYRVNLCQLTLTSQETFSFQMDSACHGRTPSDERTESSDGALLLQ